MRAVPVVEPMSTGRNGRRTLALGLAVVAAGGAVLALVHPAAVIGGLVVAAVFGALAIVAWTWDRVTPELAPSSWFSSWMYPMTTELRRNEVVRARMTPAERRAAFLRERGFRGRVTILDAHPTGLVLESDPVLDLELLVHDPRHEPYTVVRREAVPVECTGYLSRHASFFAHIHPENRSSLLIDWNVRAIA